MLKYNYSQFLMWFSPLEYVTVTTNLCHCYSLSMSLCIMYAQLAIIHLTHIGHSTPHFTWYGTERLIDMYLVMRRILIFVHPLDKTEIFLKFLYFYMYTCLYLNCMSEETRRWLIRLCSYVRVSWGYSNCKDCSY